MNTGSKSLNAAANESRAKLTTDFWNKIDSNLKQKQVAGRVRQQEVPLDGSMVNDLLNWFHKVVNLTDEVRTLSVATDAPARAGGRVDLAPGVSACFDSPSPRP